MPTPMRCLPALLALACASGGAFVEAPSFTRSRPYTPEDLNRDVVACAEDARIRLATREASAELSREELRAELHQSTSECMAGRGWKRG